VFITTPRYLPFETTTVAPREPLQRCIRALRGWNRGESWQAGGQLLTAGADLN